MDTEAKSALAAGRVIEVAIADLHPDPGQPRQSFDEAELKPLAASIKERGVMQPIQVRVFGGLYMIVDGERRWRAAKLAKLKTIPAILFEAAEDLEQLRVDQVGINELRAKLKPLELGHLLKRLRDEGRKSPNEIAAYLDKNGLGALTRNQVDDLIGLTELPTWAHELVDAGQVEPKVIGAVRRFKDQPEIMKAVKAGLGRAGEWKGKILGEDINEAVHEALLDSLQVLDDVASDDAVLFDWKIRCKGCEFLVQHERVPFCSNRKLFQQHQAEAREAGLGPGGKRVRGGGTGAGDAKEREPTAAEVREKTAQRKRSLGDKARDYLWAYLQRALLPKLKEAAEELMMWQALKRPGTWARSWDVRGPPECHFPDGQAEPSKFGDRKAAESLKVGTLDQLLKAKSAYREKVLPVLAREVLFELPFRETQGLAHHLLGNDVAKIWKLERAFLELFRKGELVHLAKQHEIPQQPYKAWDAMKGEELKLEILKHPGLVKAPRILVDLYAKIDKPESL